MRIIAGRFKSRKIYSTKAKWLRPTSDRTREVIFSLINYPFEGCHILDLYAGTGALGIEAFSRGASVGTFVDQSPIATALVKKNLQLLGIEAQCYTTSAFLFLKRAAKEKLQYDIIFCDPPYRSREIPEIVKQIIENKILRPNGLLVLETDRQQTIAGIDDVMMIKEKKVGDTYITILKRVNEE